MSKATHPPHLILKRRQFFVRLGVPTEVQDVLQRKWFIAPLGESDPDKAYTKSLPILAGWRERIAVARLGSTDPDRVEAERLTREYVKHLGKPLDDASVALLTDAMAWLLRRYGGVVPGS